MGISEFQLQQMLARTQKNRVPDNSEGVEDESALHEAIRKECQYRGWISFHSRMDVPQTANLGTPDFIIATDDGRTLYVEVKRRTGKLSPAQNAMVAWLAKNRQRVAVVKTLMQFIEFADGLDS